MLFSRPSLAPFLLLLALLVSAPAVAGNTPQPYPAELLEEYPEGIQQVEVEELEPAEEHLYIGYDQPRPLHPSYASGSSFRESAASRLLESANVAIPRGFDPIAAEPPTEQLTEEAVLRAPPAETAQPAALLLARAPAGLAPPVALEGFPLRRSETESAVREYVKAFEGSEPSLFTRVRGAHWRALGSP